MNERQDLQSSNGAVPPKADEAPSPSGDVTRLLGRIESGDEAARDELFPLVFDHMRALAGRYFRRSDGGQTLQPTALVHDAFMKLVERSRDWSDRQHFFAVAARAMRQLLTDAARERGARKRGGDWGRVSLSWTQEDPRSKEVDVVDLDAALSELSALSDRQCRIVELRFLTGLSVQETADILGVSTTTVGDEWRAARTFLRRFLHERAG